MPDSSPLLVLGDDGQEPSHRAWKWILAHRWPGWQVEVLTADTGEELVEWGKPPKREEWTPPWPRSETVPEAASTRFMRVRTDPRAMLAEREGVDLMVLGLRTHSYLQAMVTGSTTEWTMHHPPSPLVVATCSDPVEKVTVCVDGSAHSRYAYETFARLPFAPDSHVTVLAVDDGRADAQAGAEEAAADLDGRVADIHVMLESGRPTQTILAHLDRARPQLVVLGTRGLTGWKRLRLGSTASAVVRAAHCSSLVACQEETTG
jgi:nucleotide-binding universal stress UspA family protein